MFGYNLRRAAVLVAGSAMMLTACGSGAASGPAGDEIRIGLITSQTGPAASFGIPEQDAVMYLAKQANDNGGFNGRKVTIISKDDKTDPTEAAKVARDLILTDKVHVIIGPTTGSGALAVGPIAAQSKVPVVAPTGTISVTAEDSGFFDWIFRSTANDREQVDLEFDYIKDRGYKRIGSFFQQDAYGESSAKHLRSLVDAHPGFAVTAEASAPLTATDLSTQATKIAAADPDVVVVQTSSPATAAALVRGLNQAGSKAAVIVAGGTTTQTFVDAAGPASEGVVALYGVGWDKPTPMMREFIDGYGKKPDNFGEAIAGTAFLAVKTAVEKIDGDITGSDLRDSLATTCPFPTLTNRGDGCYSADNHDGDLAGPFLLTVTDGRWVTQ